MTLPLATALLALLGCEAPLPEGAPAAAVAFGFPLPERERFQNVIGFDHDPEEQSGVLGRLLCTAHDGRAFPACYDGHDGTDYMLSGGFDAMDAGSSPIVAAADGVVVFTHDGEYDRCRAEGDDIGCDGHPRVANRVHLQHFDGTVSWYLHLQRDSVAVRVGQVVRCGELLGYVGSSGYSSGPHLHFEVQRADGTEVDPYAGAFSQPETWWWGQVADDGLPEAGCAAP